MKKILLLFLFFPFCSYGQNTFQKTYGSANHEYGYSILQTADGGYVMAGSFYNVGMGDYDVYLVRTDNNGNLLWTKTFGGTGEDQGYCIVQASDGGFVIAGSTASFGAGVHDMYLLKTNASGNLQWSKTYGEIDYDYAYSLKQTNDGGYILAGRSFGFIPTYGAVYLVKTDSTGNLLWAKGYGATDFNYWGTSVDQSADSGYVVTGHVYDFNTGNMDAFLLKTAANGNLAWIKSYGGASNDYGNSVKLTADGGFAIGGSTESFGAGASDIYLVKTGDNGNLSWSKAVGGTIGDYGRQIRQSADGSYVISGNIDTGPGDVYIVKTNSNGAFLWSKSYGGTSYVEYGESFYPTSDGGYVIGGSTMSYGSGGTDMYLIKTDSMGSSGCAISISAGSVNASTVVAALSVSVASGGVAGNAATITGSGGVATTPCFVPCTFSLSITSSPILCYGDSTSATAVATGGTEPYTYSWTPTGDTTATINNLNGGNYTVTVFDSAGCSATQTVSITEPPPLVANAQVVNDVLCNGQSTGSVTCIAAGGVGGYSYYWFPTGSNAQTLNGIPAGCYTVIVTDANGCTATDTVCITQPLPPFLSINQANVLCYGASQGAIYVNFNSGNPPYTYSWTPVVSNSASASNLSAGSYSVTITDSIGCSFTAVATITQPLQLTATLNSTDASCSTCSDGSSIVTPGGGSGPYTYSWNTTPAQYGLTATLLSPGVYTCCVTDGNGCTLCVSDSVSFPSSVNLISNNENGITIIPNPFTNQLTVISKSSSLISLFDYTGKEILHQKIFSGEVILNTESLAAGLYFLKVDDGRAERNYKVVKGN
jgi:hypothetical protein